MLDIRNVHIALALMAATPVVPAPSAVASGKWAVEIWAYPLQPGEWGGPVGLTYDRGRGELYMADPPRGLVRVFDRAGIERFAFSHQVPGRDGRASDRGEPRSLAVRDDGRIYLVDQLSPAVSLLNFRGERVDALDVALAVGREPGTVRPQAVTLGPDRCIYVATAGAATGVLVFDEHDRVVRRIGYDLEGIQAPRAPRALDVDPDGGVWLAEERGFPVVKHYGPDGEYLGGFGGRGLSDRDFSFPSDLLRADDGTIWIADAIRQAVKHFTSTGELIELVGGYGVNPGELQYPSALAGDGVTELFVCERVGRRIQRYAPAMPDNEVAAERVQTDVVARGSVR